MGTISLTLPTAGTVIAAGLHSTNYSTLQALANGGIDNNNFAGGRIFDPAKLMQAGATAGQTLLWDGASSTWKPGSVGVTYRKSTAKTVVSTVAATDLLNGEITVGAGVMGASGVLRLTAWGDWVQNTGAGQNSPRWQLLLGGVTLLDTGAIAGTAAATSASRFPWKAVIEVQNLGVANSQQASMLLTYVLSGGATSAPAFTTGEGVHSVVSGQPQGLAQGINTAAVDTSVAKALALNVILPVNSASCDMKLLGALVEVV